MRNRKNMGTRMMTRRSVLGSGLACALASLTTHKESASGVALDVGPDRLADLYVFPRATRTVIAVTWLARASYQKSDLRIHAGPHCWSVKIPGGEAKPVEWVESRCRIFAGRILSNVKMPGEPLDAVVMEAPSWMISGTGMTGIWAERLTPDGSRQRIGSPFLADIVAGNAALAALYHSTWPAEDTVVLTKRVAEAIAENARAGGEVHNSDMHGRRLASILLPDVLHYDPKLPAGFTFAAQNGRHPEEASHVVVNAILRGSSVPAPRTKFRLEKRFPYFPQRITVA
jgi:hypothetical protein